MFLKLAPQKVQHSDGYIVQVTDRFHVEYMEGARRAIIEVDFASITGVYRDTLQMWSQAETERALVLSRIVGGLEAMGCKVEIC